MPILKTSNTESEISKTNNISVLRNMKNSLTLVVVND